MSFEAAEEVANAVLYEGYLLDPSPANALKDRFRWQFGVVAPRAYAELSEADPWYAQTECLIEPAADPAIDVRVRFLQMEGDAGLERTIDIRNLRIARLLEAEHLEQIVLPRGEERPIQGFVRVSAEQAGAVIKLRLRIENATKVASAESRRNQALRSAFVGTHALLVVRGGRFVSLVGAPGEIAAAAASCVNLHACPVLIGDPGDPDRCDTLLSSPIILYDFPSITPESLARGSRVVVRPRRRADAIDLLIEGRTARVEGVSRDVDGRVLVAVVLDDPAGELHAEFGRFLYYQPEELEPAG